MEKYDEQKINDILVQLNNALLPIARQLGVTINITEPKFSDIYFEAKLSMNIVGAEALAEEERKKFYMENCDSIYLSKLHWGMEFVFPPLNHKCKIYGLDFHDSENPIILQDLEDLKLYRTSPMFFLNAI